MYQFKLLKKDPASGARLGRIYTTHGEVNTPVFMPVATQGTVKSLIPETVKDLGSGNDPCKHLPPLFEARARNH